MRKSPLVAIVVLNYNGEHLLRQCIDALYETDYPKNRYNVIVVDNASTDRSVHIIKSEYPKVKIVHSKKNIGVAANNFGVEFALKGKKTDYVVLLNNDVIVQKHWLTELIKASESDPTIGAFGPTVLNSNGTVQSLGGTVDLIGTPYLITRHKSTGVVDVSWISACCIMLKAEALNRLEYLVDPRFFIFYDEIDYCWRLKLEGYRTVFVPKAAVMHKGSVTIKTSNKKYNKFIMEHYKNKIFTFKKNFRMPLKQVLLFPMFFTTLILVSYWALRNQWGYGTSILKYFFTKENQTKGLNNIPLKKQLALLNLNVI